MYPSNHTHKEQTPKAQRGFSLLESLVALTIAAFAITALFQTFSTGLRAVSITDDHTQARMLARSLLSEHTTGWTKPPKSQKGTYKDFAWTVNIRQADTALGAIPKKSKWQLYHVDVTVSWSSNRQISFETLKLGPGNG